ncbi:polyisoprenoid-binding protein YceI [Mucilaginibacter gracilis]|uniref:Polyisoprenoid-binding protein YceI n=1 Tax=Mucilaginibacter gracilis TaxID=423350 RepID=A0A495J3G3_9SPHI|nr:YceI family protein [Mucilaginibacter gracilis]RKR83525.1 polyisoprenoid-binding protein YceI [Mucilaginibacter gracilis]
MKKNIHQSIVLLFIGLFVLVLAGSTWKVKGDEAVVEFTGGKISGSFKGLKADIVFDKEHPEQAKISASIEVPTIATGFFLKNSHAKDALGADEHPQIKFSSTSVSKAGDAYLAKGNLTMKGATKPVTIRFTFDDKGNQGVFKGSFKVIPKEFGVDRAGTPDEVTVNLTVPVTK